QLDHPNTVHVYDFGKEKDNYYIVMSYVDGKSLEEIIKEKKFLSVQEASDIMIGVFEGLNHAHSKNIIHRDIKPSNIILTSQKIPRIIDFGLARRVVEEKQLTITGEMIGTAYFMSPEQGLGKKVDHRADLYAAGATYFYLLTGKYPFEGKSAIEVINKHINESIPNLYVLKPELPIWTVKIIEKLMKKNPDERYQSAKEVADELAKYKQKNYENIILSNETEINLDELKKNQEMLSATIRIKPQDKDKTIEGIEIKPKTENKNITEKDQKDDNRPPAPKNKLQSTILFSITKSVYHIFYSFVSLSSFLLFSTYIIDGTNFVKSAISKPFSLLFLISGLVFLWLSAKTSKIKSPFSYFIIAISIILTAILGHSQKNLQTDYVSEKIIYLLKSIFVDKSNLFIISLGSVIISQIFFNSFKSIKSKIISLFFFLISVYLAGLSITYLAGENSETQAVYAFVAFAFFISIAQIFYFKKNLIFIFFLIIFSSQIYFARKDFVDNFAESKYQTEVSKYKKAREEIIIKTREKFYSNLENLESSSVFSDIEEKAKQEIKQNLLTLKEPTMESIKLELEKEYFKNMTQKLYSKYLENFVLSALVLWIILNTVFISDIFRKEDYEI
ncbi:MAG: protein kinase, partial [Elusimicrobiales bacterium]|nr:protein kinase [Elusimicrobiales bacterium]